MHRPSFEDLSQVSADPVALPLLSDLDELGPNSGDIEMEPEPETLPATTRRPVLRLVLGGDGELGDDDVIDELLLLDDRQAAMLVHDVLDANDELIEVEPETLPAPRVDEDALTAPIHLLDMASVPELSEIAEVEDLFTDEEVAKLRVSVVPPFSPLAFVPPPPPSRSDMTSLSPFSIEGDILRLSLAPEPMRPVRTARGWTIAAVAACSMMFAASMASWMPGSSLHSGVASRALSPMSMPLVMTAEPAREAPADDMAIVVDVAPLYMDVNERPGREDASDRRESKREKNEAKEAETTAEAPVEAPVELAEFDVSKAQGSLASATGAASTCNDASGPSGMARVSITFAPSGRVTQAVVDGPPFAGTPLGSCIASKFRAASVPAFRGGPVTVKQTVHIR
jgi:hypothetical protein